MMGMIASVVGATGLVGKEVVIQLCNDTSFETVHVLVRRAITDESIVNHPKLVQHIVDFGRLAHVEWPQSDVLFCCLGTTIRDAGSKAAFRAVDFDYVIEAARQARKAGASSLVVVSAIGANPRSKVFYNRVKGEMEIAVAGFGFQSLTVLRPSLLSGKRAQSRPAERVGLAMTKIAKRLIPARYGPIPSYAVARAMIAAAKNNTHPIAIIESDKIQDFC